MACADIPKSTKLTEAQARLLADWLGGSYHLAAGSESQGEPCHGVVVDPSGRQKIFSLEQARALENYRDAVNPGSPDWVG